MLEKQRKNSLGNHLSKRYASNNNAKNRIRSRIQQSYDTGYYKSSMSKQKEDVDITEKDNKALNLPILNKRHQRRVFINAKG